MRFPALATFSLLTLATLGKAQQPLDTSYTRQIRAYTSEPRFNTDFRSTPGSKVAYHAPCHLRAQGVGFKGRDLLRKIPGVVARASDLATAGIATNEHGHAAIRCHRFDHPLDR